MRTLTLILTLDLQHNTEQDGYHINLLFHSSPHNLEHDTRANNKQHASSLNGCNDKLVHVFGAYHQVCLCLGAGVRTLTLILFDFLTLVLQHSSSLLQCFSFCVKQKLVDNNSRSDNAIPACQVSNEFYFASGEREH